MAMQKLWPKTCPEYDKEQGKGEKKNKKNHLNKNKVTEKKKVMVMSMVQDNRYEKG